MGVQAQAIVVAWSFVFEIGPKSGRIATLESANGKSQMEDVYWTTTSCKISSAVNDAIRKDVKQVLDQMEKTRDHLFALKLEPP